MSIVWTGLAPHAPIIIPEIGQDRHVEAKTTWESCQKLAMDFMDHKCDLLVVLSPHTSRPRRGVNLMCDAILKGSFSKFGHPGLKYTFLNAFEWVQEFSRHYSPLSLLEREPLDHGALVPLHFISESGWIGPTVVMSVPWDESECSKLGTAIQHTSMKRVGILASGDMSHCLKQGAPSGFHPSGQQFDDHFVSLLKAGKFRDVDAETKALRQTACEDVFTSCQIAWEATSFQSDKSLFYSYEGPFGVGYTVVRLFSSLV